MSDTDYYAYDLHKMAQANPFVLQTRWSPDKGVFFWTIEENDFIRDKIEDGKLYLPVDMVDNYGLVWDHVDISKIGNKLMDAMNHGGTDYVVELSRRINPNASAIATEEFNEMIYKYITPTTNKNLVSCPTDLDPENILNALTLSWLFAWAKEDENKL